MTSPKTIESAEVRTRILDILQTGPKRTVELTQAIYPGAPTQTPDKAPSKWSSQVSMCARTLETQGKIEKDNPKNRFSPWSLRTKPLVDDLPANPKPTRTYKRKGEAEAAPSNGYTNSFKSYLIREIRMKLDELERMG